MDNINLGTFDRFSNSVTCLNFVIASFMIAGSTPNDGAPKLVQNREGQVLRNRPVQVSVSKYKIPYLDTKYCILYLYLDTFFGEYLEMYLYLATFFG